MTNNNNPISLDGLAYGLAETAQELRDGVAVDPDYLDRVAEALWAWLADPSRRLDEPEHD